MLRTFCSALIMTASEVYVYLCTVLSRDGAISEQSSCSIQTRRRDQDAVVRIKLQEVVCRA